MDSKLKGKVVVITGASGGIGSAIARAFADEGARLVLHYRNNRAKAITLQKELASRTETLVARADLASETDARRLFARAHERFGRVDTVIANAGSWETADVPLHKMSLGQWRRTLDGV